VNRIVSAAFTSWGRAGRRRTRPGRWGRWPSRRPVLAWRSPPGRGNGGWLLRA